MLSTFPYIEQILHCVEASRAIVRQVGGIQEMGFIYSNIGIAIWFRIQSADLRSRAIPDVGSSRYNWNAANLRGKFMGPTPIRPIPLARSMHTFICICMNVHAHDL